MISGPIRPTKNKIDRCTKRVTPTEKSSKDRKCFDYIDVEYEDVDSEDDITSVQEHRLNDVPVYIYDKKANLKIIHKLSNELCKV